MEKTMRWFGPNDPVSLQDIRQAGCTGVVTALHHISVGDIWPIAEIEKRKKEIESAGMSWTVIESLPVSEDIKKQSGDFLTHIENYKTSLSNVAKCGLKIVTYNFMPILDWMRTDPRHMRKDGSLTLRFEKIAFIVFDVFLLKRPSAKSDYSENDLRLAKLKFSSMTVEEKNILFENCLLGLPGSEEAFTPEGILCALKEYEGIDANKLKQHLLYFLQQIVPLAEDLKIKLAIHPDDPPYSILGLPRIVSTKEDLKFIIECYPSPSNGLCLCTGSLGVRQDNDISEIIQRFGKNIHFLHLRNTTRDSDGNFEEAEHLSGDTDMAFVIKIILELMQKRKVSLPVRPDHGFQMMIDIQKNTYPGYSAIGRMKGLSELRGLEMGLANSIF
ncbi:MAG: mannonate dehydratase [Reichenbachiella sp.]